MKLLICGDRNWKDEKLIEDVLRMFSTENPLIIHGAARGADTIAGNVAKKLGLEVQAFPANWELYGKAAGAIRNTRMLKENPELVIAFHDSIGRSKGTLNMIRQAQKAGIRIIIYNHTHGPVLL